MNICGLQRPKLQASFFPWITVKQARSSTLRLACGTLVQSAGLIKMSVLDKNEYWLDKNEWGETYE